MFGLGGHEWFLGWFAAGKARWILVVIPAKAGIQCLSPTRHGGKSLRRWIPAFAGMTVLCILEKSGMRERQPCVYLLASHRNGTLYTGVTSSLPVRIWQHRNEVIDGFTQRHHVHGLVWFEVHDTMESAIVREKAIKVWKRAWKIELIEKSNPYWRDLYTEICQ